jgi:hypothetical protein
MKMERSGEDLSDYSFTYVLRSKNSGEQETLVIRDETSSIESIRLGEGSSLVFFGEVGRSAHDVNIFDVATGKLRDSFLCYGCQMSPSGKYLLFKHWYPRFAERFLTSDVLLIYDLSSTPAANRIGGSVETDAVGHPVFPQDAVGHPIFPQKNVAAKSVDSLAAENDTDLDVISGAGFVWGENDSSILFVNIRKSGLWLETVDLSKGLSAVQLKEKKIDFSTVLRDGDANNVAGVSPIGIQVNGGSVTIRLAPTSRLKASEIKVVP